MRIVLIGFMGSGKTTVAELLGRRLKLPVREMDSLTAERAGVCSVKELIETRGEAIFRSFEREVLASMQSEDDVVLSTGGGAIVNDAHCAALKTPCSKLVYLRTSFDTILKRVDAAERPLLRNLENARTLYDNRLHRYADWADLIVDTDDLSPEKVSDTIIQKLAGPRGLSK